MKVLLRKVFIVFLSVCMLISTNIVMSANGANPVICVISPPASDAKELDGNIYNACNNINEKIWESKEFVKGNYKVSFLTCSYEKKTKTCNITVNMNAYNKLDTEEKQLVMQIALDGIFSSDITRVNKNKIYNALSALDSTTSSLVRQLSRDVSADFYKAYRYFEPFTGPIGIVLGVLTLLIFLLLAITGVIDIAYITIPTFRLMLDHPGSDEKPRFVSIEAAYAVKEAESKSGQGYVSPMTIYLGSKIKQFVAIAICLLYLSSGQIFIILSYWIDMFNGLMK